MQLSAEAARSNQRQASLSVCWVGREEDECKGGVGDGKGGRRGEGGEGWASAVGVFVGVIVKLKF